MAKPLPRLPIAGVGGEPPTISLSDDRWSQIEAACDCSFDSELRDAIRIRTNVYLGDAQFELNAKPRAPAVDLLQRRRKAGARFQDELMSAEPESARYANSLIKKNFADSRLRYGGPTDAIHALHGVIESFLFACDRAEKEVETDVGFQRGDDWNVWVRDLARILQKRGFRTGVRKDTDKSDTTSSFVVFIRELQKLIPPSFRRGSHSEVALATLISKVRGR
jgi:hypothetical protein